MLLVLLFLLDVADNCDQEDAAFEALACDCDTCTGTGTPRSRSGPGSRQAEIRRVVMHRNQTLWCMTLSLLFASIIVLVVIRIHATPIAIARSRIFISIFRPQRQRSRISNVAPYNRRTSITVVVAVPVPTSLVCRHWSHRSLATLAAVRASLIRAFNTSPPPEPEPPTPPPPFTGSANDGICICICVGAGTGTSVGKPKAIGPCFGAAPPTNNTSTSATIVIVPSSRSRRPIDRLDTIPIKINHRRREISTGIALTGFSMDFATRFQCSHEKLLDLGP
ncbi:hypothetical protein KCU88_g349, partial [Aureobasidium melanogenum]